MDIADVIRRILDSAHGEGICDACLAFAVEMPLSTVQCITSDSSMTSADYVQNVGPCHNCGRVTARTAFIGVAKDRDSGTVADAGRQRKCVRCSRRVAQDDEHHVNGDLFHRQCWAILQSQAEIANARQMMRLSRALIRRSRGRIGGNNPTSE